VCRGCASFFDHGNGIAICRAYTGGKIKFIRPDGSVGEAPGHGSAFIAMGSVACAALRQSGIGFCVTVKRDTTEAGSHATA
jgi:hypothetical protein